MYFVFFGMFGMVMELIFTAFRDLVRGQGDVSLQGHTSLWMFPVYALGLTYGLDTVAHLITNDWVRYFSYPFLIWGIELTIGLTVSHWNVRIWDYHYLPQKYHWRGIISYAHFPVWIFFGLLVETIKTVLPM